MINWQYMKNALNEKVINSFICLQVGCIKRWSQEQKVPLWNWRSAGLFSPQTLWTIISRQSAAPPNWELWSSTASALWCSQTRRSSRTLVSSLSMSFSFLLIIKGKYTNLRKPYISPLKVWKVERLVDLLYLYLYFTIFCVFSLVKFEQ